MPGGGTSLGSVGSGTGPIPGLSGCFLWYAASSLAITGGNASQVTYWQDMSGSGNNLAYPPGDSSNVYIPHYYTNVINGYPVVRFSGTNYLECLNNNSLNLQGSGYTAFYVFSATGLNNQVIMSNAANTFDSAIDFVVAISSAFSFTTSQNTITTNSGVPASTFMLRHDRFTSQAELYMGYFGIDIASGVTYMTSSNPNLYVGYCPAFGYQNPACFQGDIAEIIAYDLPLTTGQTYSVDKYLINKYFGSSPTPTPTPPSFFQPNNISGCFAWYVSTNIGITGVDGTNVQYWPDSSGSGNNIGINLGSSGSWLIPTFHRNVINGYPTVRFTEGAGNGYLYNNASGNAITFSYTDLTVFTVFIANDGTDEQCICSITDDSNNIVFDVGINYGVYAQGFNFSYTDNGPSGIIYSVANSPTFGTNMYSPGVTMIRHDRFRQGDSEFMFGRYGADVASGVATTLFSTPRSINLGGVPGHGIGFYGDVPEIIMYNRQLSANEVQEVNQYLILKYQPSNVRTCGLFTYASQFSGLYAGKNLYVNGGYPTQSGSFTLYTESAQIINNNKTLYTTSNSYSSGNFSLYISASQQQYPPVRLYTYGGTSTTNVAPLYIGSARYVENDTTLYINAEPILSTGLALYTQASLQKFPPITLYLDCLAPTGQVLTMYTAGYGPPTETGGVSLFVSNIGGVVSGLYSDIPLFLSAGSTYSSMDLFIATVPINTNPATQMPLYIGASLTGNIYVNIPLFICNNTSGIAPGKKLFVAGFGSLNGGLVYNSPMFPLYLYHTSGISAGLPLMVFNATTTSGGSPLFIDSASNSQSGLSLYISGEGMNTVSTHLFIDGGSGASGSFSLWTQGGFPSTSNNTTIYEHGF